MMKKIFCALMLVCLMVSGAFADVPIDAEHFPDQVFMVYIFTYYDLNKDLTLSDSEIAEVKTMRYDRPNNSSYAISTLEGIQYLTNLESISCKNHNLTELDFSGNKLLNYINCSGNPLQSLDVSQNEALYNLYCDNTQLIKLDLRNNKALRRLNCQNNSLTELDVSYNENLERLYCDGNDLQELKLNEALRFLYCNYNELTKLDVSKTKMEVLACFNNNITDLQLGNNDKFTHLHCAANQLQKLDVSGLTELTHLYCYRNFLSELDLSNNTSLELLSCGNNLIEKLDLSNNTSLTTLRCARNRLSALDLSSNKLLPVDLTSNSLDITSQAVKKFNITLTDDFIEDYPYELDLSTYMTSAQLNNINLASIKGFYEDDTEIPTEYEDGKAYFMFEPARVRYTYNIGLSSLSMDVTISDMNSLHADLDNHVYYFVKTTMTWENAKTYCESIGGHLVTIDTNEEGDLLLDLLNRANLNDDYEYPFFWIGGFYNSASNRVEETADWAIFVYTNVNEQTNVTIIPLSSDRYALGFICEWDSIALASRDVAALNPEYLEYIKDPSAYYEGEFYGCIPEPIDYSHLENNPPDPDGDDIDNSVIISAVRSAYSTSDRKFDPTDSTRPEYRERKFPSIKNQKYYGTCWAHAALGALEINAMLKGIASAPDLSELQMAWFIYKDPRSDHAYPLRDVKETILMQGGTPSKAITFLQRSGITDESSLPYPEPWSLSDAGVQNLIKKKYPEEYPNSNIALKEARSITKNEIKRSVLEQGSVAIAYYLEDGNRDYSYYYPSNQQLNHMVTIVGWDDDYSRTNFKSNVPKNNGAWLIKNSHGTSFGKNGYAWMSYEQQIFYPTVFIAQAAVKGEQNITNSALGIDNILSYNWLSNMFRATGDMTVNKVFFHTPDNNVSYEIYVRKHGTDDPANPGVISGNADLSGKMSYAGYHTATLTNPVQISTGEYFSVSIKLTASANSSTRYLAAATKGNVTTARTTAGKSYFATKTTAPNANEWTDTARIQGGSYSAYVIPIISYAGAASDTNNVTISRTFSSGTVGVEYLDYIEASGGTAPYSWKRVGDTLPGGLDIGFRRDDSEYKCVYIWGTPTESGTCNFSISVTDSVGKTVTKNFSLVINSSGGGENPSVGVGGGGGGGGCSAGLGIAGLAIALIFVTKKR